MKVSVIGSRNYDDKDRLFDYLDSKIDKIDLIVSGGAIGADELAHEWAKSRGKSILIHYPDWKKEGKIAGFKRNKKIIDDAEIVVCFWDGVSRGTKSSIGLAKEQKKKVIINYF